MEVKKSGSFFEFEWKKIILSLILILLFGYQTYVYISIGNVMNEYTCENSKYIQDIIQYRNQNNSEMIKKVSEDFKPTADKFQEDLKKPLGSENLFYITSTIYPIFPVPCEIITENFCRYYMNKESFNCMNDMKSGLKSSFSSLFELEEVTYKPVSIWLLAIHFFILFVIGYLISCIILWIFKNRNKTLLILKIKK